VIRFSPRMAKIAKHLLSVYVVGKFAILYYICGPRSFLDALLVVVAIYLSVTAMVLFSEAVVLVTINGYAATFAAVVGSCFCGLLLLFFHLVGLSCFTFSSCTVILTLVGFVLVNRKSLARKGSMWMQEAKLKMRCVYDKNFKWRCRNN
jgi:hypothetical protein